MNMRCDIKDGELQEMPSEHAKTLAKTRAKLIEDRRKYAIKLCGEGQPEEFERWRPIFVQIQETIEAVDRALADECGPGEIGASVRDRRHLEPAELGNATPYY